MTAAGSNSQDREPRFAGSVAWVPADEADQQVAAPPPGWAPPPVNPGAPADPDAPPSPWSGAAQEAQQAHDAQPFFDAGPQSALEPVVQYSPGPAEGEALTPRVAVVPWWSPPVLAIAGGGLAVVGSLLDWATLRLTQSPETALNDTSTSDITYNGLSLLEGRVLLVVGIVALVLATLRLLGRLRPATAWLGLALAGGLGLVAVLFAAIGHPAELSTLFRSYSQIDTVKVSLPNGVGVWLAMGGAALILVGGLMARMSESGSQE